MEDQKERLIRYLDDAWAVEKSLVAALDKLADDSPDQTQRAMYQEHRTVTHSQEERLEARIRALGEEPSGGKGFFSTMLGKVSELVHKPHDDYDKATQDLMKQYAIENFECAMYQSLRAYASAIGDLETVRLAEEHLSQEQQTAQRVWNLIEPTATRPADGFTPSSASSIDSDERAGVA